MNPIEIIESFLNGRSEAYITAKQTDWIKSVINSGRYSYARRLTHTNNNGYIGLVTYEIDDQQKRIYYSIRPFPSKSAFIKADNYGIRVDKIRKQNEAKLAELEKELVEKTTIVNDPQCKNIMPQIFIDTFNHDIEIIKKQIANLKSSLNIK